MFCAIVAADRNWAIGKNGMHVANIPDDVKYIRAVTSGNVVIMGRKTFEAIPASSLQLDRVNIVLSRNPYFSAPNVIHAGSLEAACQEAVKYKKDVYILGGSSVYRQMLDRCDEVQVTFIDYNYDADAYFPNLDKDPSWVRVSQSEEQTHFDTVYYYRRYLKRKYYRA